MTDSIIPVCLYHHVDKASGVYRCRITTSTKVRKIDGTYTYKCPKDTNNVWKLVSVFYAIQPLFRPIPAGMKLFCAKRSKLPPYHTTNVELVYDVFDNSVDGTYFITYSTPVPNATPLYTWVSKSGAFSDFSTSSPPSDINTPVMTDIHRDVSSIKHTKIWDSAMINPIYVLHPSIMGPDYTKIKFMCNNGSCLPHAGQEWIEKSRAAKKVGWTGPDIYNPGHIHHEPMSLPECLVNCNELVRIKDGGGSPMNLINIIKRSQHNETDTYSTQKGQSHISEWVIGILIMAAVMAAVIISLIYRHHFICVYV